MSDKEVLYKAILKAEKNGYTGHLNYLPIVKVNNPEKLAATIFLENCSRIIFSHSFAKAFWGENLVDIDNPESIKTKRMQNTIFVWEYHLQQMVVKEEPLRYLENFIINPTKA